MEHVHTTLGGRRWGVSKRGPIGAPYYVVIVGSQPSSFGRTYQHFMDTKSKHVVESGNRSDFL